MTDVVTTLRALIREELSALRLGDLGVVTTARPHTSEDDAANYECDVRLRDEDLELRRVPLATPHVGMVSAPAPGDLVLISYVGGDPNQPIVLGRLYHEEQRPPLHEEGEWRVEAPVDGPTSIAIDADQRVVVTADQTIVTVGTDGKVSVEGATELTVACDGKVAIECADAEITAKGNVVLGGEGGGVITTQSHRCYVTGQALVGSVTVTAKG